MGQQALGCLAELVGPQCLRESGELSFRGHPGLGVDGAGDTVPEPANDGDVVASGGARTLRGGCGDQYRFDGGTGQCDGRRQLGGIPDAPTCVGPGDTQGIGEYIAQARAPELSRNMSGDKLIDNPVGCRRDAPQQRLHVTQNRESVMTRQRARVEFRQCVDSPTEPGEDLCRIAIRYRTHVRMIPRHSGTRAPNVLNDSHVTQVFSGIRGGQG